MEAFINNIFHYPTVLYTVFLGFMILYWMFAIVGMFDIDVLDFDADIDSDLDLDGLTGFAGLMVSLGLTGVPITLVVTLLALLGWIFSFLVVHFFFFWDTSSWMTYLVGTGVLIGAFALAIPVTAQLIKPLRPVFKKAYVPPPEKVLLGRSCVVRSTRVDERFGEATADIDGVSLILKIRADESKKIKKGDVVVLLEHRAETNTYWVVPENEFNN